MFKLKLKNINLKKSFPNLKIENDDNASYVLCDDHLACEDDKINILINKNTLPLVENLINILKDDESKYIIFNTDKGVLRIKYQDIYYFQTYGTDLFLHTSSDQFLIKDTLYQLEEKLRDFNFVRTGKATLVNVGKIMEIRTAFNAKLLLILDNKEKLEVMRSYVKSFKNFLKI